MSKLTSSINPIVRAVAVMGAVAGLVTGVTYAALNSQAKLTGNTISATPGLQLSVDDGVTYGSSVLGFAFNVTPGDTAGVSKTFKMKNTTSASMALSLKVPTTVTFSGGTVDSTKVHVNLACISPTLSVSSTLSALEASDVSVTGPLTAGATASCTLTATMDTDAITAGDTVTSDSFDLRFTGV